MYKIKNLQELFWLFTVLIFTSVFVLTSNTLPVETTKIYSLNNVFGISTMYCILIFCALNVFLFFGIKEFFRRYSKKLPNTIIMFSGIVLTISLLILNII